MNEPIPNSTAIHRVAFSLVLPRANVVEYRIRHQQLWPEMRDAIAEQCGSNYSIFAAPELDRVFGYLEVDDPERWNAGSGSEVVNRWWRYMADVMPTNPDFSPIATDLT
ncbi:MAG: L-rhamnose mutarotase, partial [Microbacteriaceae bacterium]|nr:L-rhamnose mutarotase [Microbacteriaceae bacterium]